MERNEPDILAGYNVSDNGQDYERGKLDLAELSEDDFQARYKATKRQYSALLASMKVLQESYAALSEPGPLEIDIDIIDNTSYLIEDYVRLLDQMHLASYWEREGL